MLIRNRNGDVVADTADQLNLSEVDLRGASFHRADIDGGDLSDTDLADADFTGATLYGTYMYRANCQQSNFTGALLQGVVLDKANMRGANLMEAKLLMDNMNLACSLRGADLSGAQMRDAVLSECEYDSHTVFPFGFDPVGHGMVKTE